MDTQFNSRIKSEDFYDLLNKRLFDLNDKLKQVRLTIDQSQAEISRLTQKASITTAQIQRFQGDLGRFAKEELRDNYSEAMESQQRLLVMRGQLEKLQEQQNQLSGFINFLEELAESYTATSRESASRLSKSQSIETLEMMINAQEAERQRLSRQMHDGPAQALSNFIVQAEIATKLFEVDPDKAREELDKLKGSAMSTFQKIRNFVTEIRPMMLDDLGLYPTLRKHMATIKEETGIEANLTINGGEKKLEPYLEVFIFRTVQDLVGNAIKRNPNNQELRIDAVLTLDNSRVLLSVMDNGKEFTGEQLKAEDGLGIKLIQERVELLGGTFSIQTSNVASVEIMMSIPVHQIPV
ncbi:MAG TPA: histidine kinase [Anaerolineaceae bacterium]|nr:histidine kinase [Anaerolineaceae bacterium]